jgi:hypothetical protein
MQVVHFASHCPKLYCCKLYISNPKEETTLYFGIVQSLINFFCDEPIKQKNLISCRSAQLINMRHKIQHSIVCRLEDSFFQGDKIAGFGGLNLFF